MALVPKLSVIDSNNCLSFSLKDVTGIYNSVTNTGGFGSPNVTVANIVAATVAIVLTDGTTVNINVFPTLPNTDGILYQVTNVALGLGSATPIADFISYITYILTDNSANVYATSDYKFIACNSKCCVSTLDSNISVNDDCDCANPKMEAYLVANALLQSVYNALECTPQLPNKANSILIGLTDACQNNGCGCGCG